MTFSHTKHLVPNTRFITDYGRFIITAVVEEGCQCCSSNSVETPSMLMNCNLCCNSSKISIAINLEIKEITFRLPPRGGSRSFLTEAQVIN